MTRTRSAQDGPLVSVIIPTYNYAHFVLDAIGSVRQQEYSPVEIIVIDDGSTDNTRELLSGISGITYIFQENGGLSSARNRGIGEALGKYLLFLDADDVLGRTSIWKRVDQLEADTALSSVVCRSAYFRNYTLDESLAFLHHGWALPNDDAIDLALCFFNIAPPHAFLVRKKAIERVGLRFDTHLRACEDYDFWFKLALISPLPKLVKTAWVYYRQHANSMSKSRKSQAHHDAILCQRILKSFDNSNCWIGTRPRSNYLYPMLASAVSTARKLWHTGSDEFHDFLNGQVMVLHHRLMQLDEPVRITSAEIFYVSLTRLEVLRMLVRDRSIDRKTFRRLIASLPSTKSRFRIVFWSTSIHFRSMRRLLYFLKIELHFLTMRILNKVKMDIAPLP